MLELHESSKVSVDAVSGARSVLRFISVGEVRGARSVLELHGSGEVSVDRVRGARSMLELHESRDGDPGVNLESEVERGTVGGIEGETLRRIEGGVMRGVGGAIGRGEVDIKEGNSEERIPSLGSKVFAAQSITGLTRSRKGIPKIIACAPIEATKKVS